MTKAEQRIRAASLRIVGALATEGLKPTDPESDGTRIEYGGGDEIVVMVDGLNYMIQVTAVSLSDEEVDEESDQ